jgi:hypothetical protein
MADDTILPVYPRGDVSLGGGSLVTVKDVRVTARSGRRLKHSLRRTPSGVTEGQRELDVALSVEIPETGDERDWWALFLSGTKQSIRLKLPGQTREIIAVLSEESFGMTVEDAIQHGLTFIGWWSRQA